MVKNNPNKELEYKLRQQLNNFNPEEVESYLEVLLRKCLEATVEKDYLALGSVEDILNKSIVILSSNIKNFSLMYSNVKLKVATEELAKYVELDNTEAFKFFNVLPEYIEKPEKVIEENKKELEVKLYYILEDVEKGYNYLKLAFDYVYLLTYGKVEPETAAKTEAAFNHIIEVIYTKTEESFKELEGYSSYIETLNYDVFLASEEENKVNYNLIYLIKSGLEFKESYEKLKANPFENAAKFLFLDYVAFIFGLREPIENLEALEKFKESLIEEGQDYIEIYNCILEGYTANIPSYNFKTFEIVRPEIEEDPNEPEVIVPEGFKESLKKYHENLPEFLKDRFILKEDSEENVPEEESSEVDPTEENVPTN